MAEPQLGHAATSNNVVPVDGPGSSKEASSASIGLPLRQAMKQPVAEIKIHDITDKFTRACSALEVGQLVKDEYFTLFESIGALEIMDPKMDSGFLQPGEASEDDYDTLGALLPEELIGIMDQLLCYEMAWHTGYPLSQTLFTSVYIDKLLWPEPKVLEQAQFYRGEITDDKRPGVLLEVLRAYCLALVKCCDFAIARITSRDYFEEEDFCTHTYNRVLFVQVPMNVFQRELDASVERLQDGTEVEINPILRDAIVARLQFRKDFLTALDLDVPIDHLEAHWQPLLDGLTTITTTQQLGKTVPGSFSLKIQRRLASTVPPRPIVELDSADAFSKLKQLITDCKEATRFPSLPPDPIEYQNFLWAFASRTPTPLPYSRSYLANLLFHESSISIPLADMRYLVFPASPILDPTNWTLSPPRNPMLPKPPRLQLAILIDDFIDRAGQPYLEFWTALGQNRCRLRRMLNHVISAWDQLQSDAGVVDEDLKNVIGQMNAEGQVLDYPLTTWVYHKKLWMMEKAVLLGFEQDIYLPDEYAGMYLFLNNVSRKRKDLLLTVKSDFNNRLSQLRSNKSASGLQKAKEVQDGLLYIDSLLAETTATLELGLALGKFYVALLYLDLIPRPKRPFGSEQCRYELRMKNFLNLHPSEVTEFSEFNNHTKPFGPYEKPDTDEVDYTKDKIFKWMANPTFWSGMEEHVRRAKEACSLLRKLGPQAAHAVGVREAWDKEVQSTMASCVALGVAVLGLKLAAGAEGPRGITIEFPTGGQGKRYHEGWVVGKVIKV
ncbi:amino-acid N-acetyltransferas-like protein subunit Mak10 [Lojkania enalia]|uniref:Amino-acid N-acetyltransferas-like protein subunit Mak10 n=1 Tax=Lojkania enalia TaxID=147567 RepID=A0A9P4N6V5_9PLEO|nr:amino-acid N-acetyltransferas-like protein subunit Mak10 [Didymosphaeria enalia]